MNGAPGALVRSEYLYPWLFLSFRVAGLSFGLFFGGGVASERQEYVVKRWSLQRNGFDGNARILKLLQDFLERFYAALAGNADHAPLGVGLQCLVVCE